MITMLEHPFSKTPWSKIQTIFIFKSDFKCAPTSMIVPGSRRFVTFIAVIRVMSWTNNMWSGETDCVERESQGEMWSDYWKMETRGSYSIVLSHSPYAHRSHSHTEFIVCDISDKLDMRSTLWGERDRNSAMPGSGRAWDQSKSEWRVEQVTSRDMRNWV